MTKKVLFIFVFFLVFLRIFPQTGPAGIGTSATNVLWLKADAGTSSTVNNTPISAWNDQSGNGINVAQSTAAQQPSFATNVINGFPAILFDNVNASNQNDKLTGPDSPLLDNTSGYTFFYVTRPMNFGDAHVILSKRVGVGVDQSFMLFYYTSNKLNIDIQTNDNRFASNTTFAASTNYLGCLIYDGAVATPSLRCSLYNEETLDRTATESSTMVLNNASPLLIGTTDATDPRPYGGYIAEIILYRTALGNAQRIIINNSLAAKYNITLSLNDKYAGDLAANGDYDRDVAGLGQEATGSSTSFSASVTGGLTMSVNSGLDNGDYILAGHALATNTTITTDVGGMTGTNLARWERIWYVDVTNTGTSMNVNIEFDMSDGGMGAFTLGTPSNYVLLYRAGQSGNWLEVATASSISGDRIIFNSLPATGDGYITLGTRDFGTSPLPLNLLSFTAVPGKDCVELSWHTATEKNSDHFTLERSKDGIIFEPLANIKAAGNSSVPRSYKSKDEAPYPGLSYYRLKETDYNGKTSDYGVVGVTLEPSAEELNIFPNPNGGSFKLRFPDPEIKSIRVTLKDASGKEALPETHLFRENDASFSVDAVSLPPGTYYLSATAAHKLYSTSLIVK